MRPPGGRDRTGGWQSRWDEAESRWWAQKPLTWPPLQQPHLNAILRPRVPSRAPAKDPFLGGFPKPPFGAFGLG